MVLPDPSAAPLVGGLAPASPDRPRRLFQRQQERILSVVADLSDRITVLARGEVLAEGSYAEVSKNPQVIEAYMGTGHG